MILALVCARAGSVGLPHKNLRTLGGRTLIDRAIDKAVDSGVVDHVAVSTDYGPDRYTPPDHVEYVERPARLAGVRISKWPVWRHAAETVERRASFPVSAIIDVDVSRPLTTPDDVASTFDAWRQEHSRVMLAVCNAKKNPYFDTYEYGGDGYLQPSKGVGYTCRQGLPVAFEHGGITVVGVGALFGYADMWDAGVVGHEIPRAHCYDIDDATDWRVVQALAS